MDTFAPEGAKVHIYKSDWGREMTPRLEDAPGLTLAVTSGRSCHGYAPYLFVEEADGAWRFYAVCWPGNWRFTFTMEGEALFSMDRDMLQGELAPGERLPLPVVLTAYCPRGRERLCQDVRAYLRQTLPLSRMDCGLVSWNHWWRYEDAEITEDIVLANARVAAELGINLIVLDAGWFGDAEREAHWTRQRGDWEQVKPAPLPSRPALAGGTDSRPGAALRPVDGARGHGRGQLPAPGSPGMGGPAGRPAPSPSPTCAWGRRARRNTSTPTWPAWCGQPGRTG